MPRLHTLRGLTFLTALALSAAACSSSGDKADDNASGGNGPGGDATGNPAPSSGEAPGAEPPGLPALDPNAPLGGDRPVNLVEPEGASASSPRPLLVLLHGRSLTGPEQDAYFTFSERTRAAGYFMVAPTGKRDASGKTFWNATDACCDFDQSNVDDVGYIRDIIRQVVATRPVDRSRIYLVGYSNGAFLANRIACEHAWLVTGIVGVAGATFLDADRCKPSAKVSVLTVHGTTDSTIGYEGGAIEWPNPTRKVTYPSAIETTKRWGALNGCTGELTAGSTSRDFEVVRAGSETTQFRFGSCPKDGTVEHWKLEGVGHVPILAPAFFEEVFAFIEAHPRG